MTKTAFLRVYSPQAVEIGDPVPGFVHAYGILSETETEESWVTEWNGARVVCPRYLRLRVLESTLAFANAFRGLGAGLIPDAAARAADRELRQYQRDHPSHRSHVLTAAWHVPVRWFAAFQPEDREVYEVHGSPRLRFRVDLAVGTRRVENALGILRSLQVFEGPAAELEQLLEWMGDFPPGSMLELDYADVSELFDPHDLVFDDSVELVRRSLDALAEGDMMAAGENYGRVVTRWAPAFSVTFSN
ncbi:MAG TPA: hypothetical protein VIC07_07770 [Acidimicrobiia bacterium]